MDELTTKNLFLEGDDLKYNQSGEINENKLVVMEQLLNNFYNREKIEFQYDSSNVNRAILKKVLLPIIRRISPSLIANDIIGIQALSKKTDKITNNKNQQVEIDSIGRACSARWTFEHAKDYQDNKQSMDEAIILSALAQVIIAETDQELISRLRKVASKKEFETIDIRSEDVAYTTTSLIDRINQEVTRIKPNLNINSETGLWCIVSQSVLDIINKSSDFIEKKSMSYASSTKLVGILNNVNIYLDQYANQDCPILIGYKGSETDCAAIYSPFTLLVGDGVVIDPISYEPLLKFVTTYAIYEQDNINEYLGYIGIKDSSSEMDID